MTLRVGDLVRLKSGGPIMTVSEIEEGGCYTTWMSGNGEMQYGSVIEGVYDIMKAPDAPEDRHAVLGS